MQGQVPSFRKFVLFAELDDAAPPDVGIPVRLRDLLAMPRDVIEDQPLPQRQIAQRDLARPEPLDDRVQQNRAGDREIRAPRLTCRKRSERPTISMSER